jgi:hypothetical protein
MLATFSTKLLTEMTATTLSKELINDFVDYVMSFYGSDGIYPMGANRTVIRKATNDIIKIARIKGEKFCGDSIDRELVRDLLISKYNLK